MDLEESRRGEKRGGVVRMETIIRIYCMRKESIFNKRGEILKIIFQKKEKDQLG